MAGSARRIVDEIGKPMTIMGHEIGIGTSVGISLYPADADNQEALIRKADLALYEAKNAGRGDFRFLPPGHARRGAGRTVRAPAPGARPSGVLGCPA